MNKNTNVFIFLCLALIWGCQKEDTEGVSPLPVDSNNRLYDLVLISMMLPSSTKEPFVELKDEGFEVYLVALGIDSDNQVNGKIAQEDVDKTEIIGLPSSIPTSSSSFNAKYNLVLNRYDKVVQFLKEKQNKSFVIHELTDIAKFKNLKQLHLSMSSLYPFDMMPIELVDFSENRKLEVFEITNSQIRNINFNACKEINKILSRTTLYPNHFPILEKIAISECAKLEYLLYNGDPRTLDVSKNTELKYLEIMERGNTYKITQNELILCNQKKLEVLSVTPNFEHIFLSKIVEERFRNDVPPSFSFTDVGVQYYVNWSGLANKITTCE